MNKNKKNCESCMMPLAKDTIDNGSDQYCGYCYKDGKLLYEGNNLAEFKRISYKGMIEDGMSPMKAKFFTWTIGFAPRWKK